MLRPLQYLIVAVAALLGNAYPALAAHGHDSCGRHGRHHHLFTRIAQAARPTLIPLERIGVPDAVLVAPEPVAAVAVRDVDFDGDLDVLASSAHCGLLVWRNMGGGHFVLASPRAHRPRSRHGAGLMAERPVTFGSGPSDQRPLTAAVRLRAHVSILPRVAAATLAGDAPLLRSTVQHGPRPPPTYC